VIATELEPGALVDGFRIESRLHAGGMAVIYAVSRSDLPMPAVMKIPRLGQGESSASVVSFEVEQMVLETLDGGPVPRVFALGEIVREPYIVMERVSGQPLSALTPPLALPELVRTGIALAHAIQQLHERDVIHLDLKPANVMLADDGRAVLIDLGLAHHAHLPDLLAEEFRRPLGSAPYISPEQVLGIRNEARSDLFALGAILYELATGELPFGMPSSQAGLRKRLHERPLPPRRRVPTLPEALQEVILHCLEADPERRYASAAQVAFDLQHLDQVEITDRGRAQQRPGMFGRLRNWVTGMGMEPETLATPAARVHEAPIIMVAVATAYTNEAHQQSLREAAGRFAAAIPGARIACVTAVRPPPSMGGDDDALSAPRVRILQLQQLRHWAEGLPSARLTFHVLENSDAADALLEYARANHVDHILLGAPPPDLIGRSLLPPVAERVMNEAPCSVTVVRARIA